MHPTRFLLLALLSPVALPDAGATGPVRYLELINRAHDSLASVAVSPAGRNDFEPLTLGGPVPGGGGSATVEIAGEGCRYDFRLTFRPGRAVLYPDIDVCRHRGLRIQPLPRKEADTAMPDGSAAAARRTPPPASRRSAR